MAARGQASRSGFRGKSPAVETQMPRRCYSTAIEGESLTGAGQEVSTYSRRGVSNPRWKAQQMR
jgi:hypothetical protein